MVGQLKVNSPLPVSRYYYIHADLFGFCVFLDIMIMLGGVAVNVLK